MKEEKETIVKAEEKILGTSKIQKGGYFTIPKDSQTYRVFWVDSGSGLGGTAYEDIITPESNNTTPDTAALFDAVGVEVSRKSY